MRPASWLALGLLILGACSDDEDKLVPLRNECLDNTSCERIGRPYYCHNQLLACVARRAEQPYPLILRVSASTEGTVLADAGVRLVADAIKDLGILNEERDAEVLRVPTALQASGSVSDESSAGLPAQLVLTPHDTVAPFLSRVAETRGMDAGANGDTPELLPTYLNPQARYDVRVQPLLASSGVLPPVDQPDIGPDEPIQIVYDTREIERRTGKFGRDLPIEPHRVRLEEKGTGRVLSSTTRVDPDAGTFELYADPEVFQRGDRFDLVVGLAGFDPWQVTIAIPGARFLAGGEMVLPRVPATRRAVSSVTAEGTDPLIRLPYADLLFTSDYKPPPEEADSGAPPSAGGTDWCRWEDPYPIVCRGQFFDRSDEHGEWDLELIPGSYDVIILPRQDDPASLAVAATENAAPVEVQVDGGVGVQAVQGERRTPYRGTISVQTRDGRVPAPGIVMRSVVRPTPAFSTWGEIADYNRSYATTTNGKGQFDLYTDVGYYDFVMEPSAGSNFPWKLWLDCPNGPDRGTSLAPITLANPVIVSGVVEAESMGVRLPNARIDAFAVVHRTGEGPARSVLIGSTVSDENGEYHLLLPPKVGENTRHCEGEVVTDSER